MEPKLLIVLETKNWEEIKERRALIHDGGQLLTWMIRRLSIPRDRWVHTYCYEGNKKSIPSKLWKRKGFLDPHVDALLDFATKNSPCSVVAMGKFSTEVLIGGSLLKRKVGAEWDTRPKFRKIGIEKAWVTYMPDAALYSPDLVVDITRMLMCAAHEAHIKTKIDYSLPVFRNWYKYY